MGIDLLLAHADDSLPTLEKGLSRDTATAAVRAGMEKAEGFRDEGADPNHLPAQRWGIVAPKGEEGDRLLALMSDQAALGGDRAEGPRGQRDARGDRAAPAAL